MRRLASRMGLLIVTVWFISTVAFISVQGLPGDPARMILGQQASEEAVRRFRVAAGLDRPVSIQYFIFVSRVAHLEFGTSLAQRQSVRDLIIERSGVTLRLICAASVIVLAFSLVVPIILLLIGSTRLERGLIYFWTLLAVAPPYVLGITVLALFAGALGWIKVIFDPSQITSWVLPSSVLAVYPTAIVLRLFDQELRRVLSSNYILYARSMGFPLRAILMQHALPNALPAALAALANGLAFFFTGTFFVEVIFGMSGLGRLTYQAISSKDIALLVPLCIIFAVTVSVISAFIDLIHVVINPRLRAWS